MTYNYEKLNLPFKKFISHNNSIVAAYYQQVLQSIFRFNETKFWGRGLNLKLN